MSQQDNKEMANYFYRASAADFKKIPGSPIAYWVDESIRNVFIDAETVGEVAYPRQGMATTNNDLFLRRWFEVDISKTKFDANDRNEAINSQAKWFPYNKGGSYRKWYGNNEFLVNFEHDGQTICDYIDNTPGVKVGSNGRVINREHYFKPSATWSFVSSSYLGVRRSDSGFIFDVGGSSSFPPSELLNQIVGFLCSKVAFYLMNVMNPTLNFQVGNIAQLPFKGLPEINTDVEEAVGVAKEDWDFFETSWNYRGLVSGLIRDKLSEYTSLLINYKRDMVQTLTKLENNINAKIAKAYRVEESIDPILSPNDVTISGNLYYRYVKDGELSQLEDRELSDTLSEVISFSIGCMMGRYSLDREGLVYAYAGNIGFSELVAEGAYQKFHADGDGILPLTSEHWFDDDVAARIEEFVRTVWGEEHLEENLQFIADSLCLSAIKPLKNTSEEVRKTIRRYLSTQFFKDHLKTYKKRPIYWLFSSGKEKAFECLVYLHRYNEATLPRMRTEYVSPLLGQMAGRIERLRLQKVDAATAEAKRLDKEIDSLTKQLTELRAFDDQLKHYADMKITLDLDDGVKVNYGKFGNLLAEVKAITGDKGE